MNATRLEEIPEVFSRARAAQKLWARKSVKERASYLDSVREVLITRSDELAEIISKENGKPKFEALANEILPGIETLWFFSNSAPRVLSDQPIKLHIVRHRKSVLNYWPLGVVAVISPWNYPFMLAWGEIIMALIAGNAVVFKPSEISPRVGSLIQDILDQAGIPSGLVQTLYGDGVLGAAMIAQKPDKVFFTGSVSTGKKIMAKAAEQLIPVSLELGGKDPMIILADANLDLAASAALWGGFSNSGQVCASVERIIIHESVAEEFLAKLKQKISKLRPGDDLGRITLPRQADTYSAQIDEAKKAGARFECGGEFNQDRTALAPTIVLGPANNPSQIESMQIYTEETFGPVVAVTTFKSLEDAIAKANRSQYGLTASVFTRDHKTAERIAREIEAGSVLINEVTYSAGLPETPWGGVKNTGIGRTHSAAGLYEFVNVRHIHSPRSRVLVFKALWWFPYTPFQYATFRTFMELYRRHFTDRLRAIPHLLWNFVQMIKKEKRL